MKTSSVIVLLAVLLTACGPLPFLTSPTTGATGIPADSGLVGVESPDAGQPTGWAIPSLEQAKVGRGGPVAADVQGYIDTGISLAAGNIPGAASFEGRDNGGQGDAFRYEINARDANGSILWSEESEYPIVWSKDSQGNIIAIQAGQKFFAIPDSKDAKVIFAGSSEQAGQFGEKPAVVRTPVSGADGVQYFLEYFDLQAREWRLNEAVLKAMTPLGGFAVWKAEDGKYYAGIAKDDGSREVLLVFDAGQKIWAEVPVPPQALPAEFANEITTYNYPFKWENNQLYVDWQDGQGLRPSGTYDPSTVEWDWQYFVYGGPALNQSDREQLIEETGFGCLGFFNEPTCVSPDTSEGVQFLVDGVFTGRRSVHSFFDPTGNVTGTQVDFEILTLDKDGNPICYWSPLQIEIDKFPGENLYGNLVNKFDSLQRSTVISLQELSDIFPKGKRIILGFRDTEKIKDIPKGSLRQYLFDGYYNDPNYAKLLNTFLDNRGVDTGSNFLIPTGCFLR